MPPVLDRDYSECNTHINGTSKALKSVLNVYHNHEVKEGNMQPANLRFSPKITQWPLAAMCLLEEFLKCFGLLWKGWGNRKRRSIKLQFVGLQAEISVSRRKKLICQDKKQYRTMSLCSQEHWNRVVSALSYPWGQMQQSSMWEGAGKDCVWLMACHPAPSDPLNGCTFPANMTNADEADGMYTLILRKRRTSIILFQCNVPIKQKLHTNKMRSQSKEQL